ncbi:hypothetical protein AVL62_06300 [Serinicoccus chungangensis]|uniref:Uncharacterized protein n=1 Tax=Serinicoccus chungangensis TaxID=767452 RepID=A0A0W8IH77_9MICO|nr:hypothetical protein AVL62_06300 [Serinicoccus chungangensis]
MSVIARTVPPVTPAMPRSARPGSEGPSAGREAAGPPRPEPAEPRPFVVVDRLAGRREAPPEPARVEVAVLATVARYPMVTVVTRVPRRPRPDRGLLVRLVTGHPATR